MGIEMTSHAFEIDEKFTYKDYLHLPDDGKRYQIVNGELCMVPAPTPHHQIVLTRIFKLLDSFVTKWNFGTVLLAPCDVILSDVDVVQPDILYISHERLNIIKSKNIEGAPDLIVEILSPYSQKIDKISKTKLYARFGVKEYWIVDPDKKEVAVLQLKGGAYKRQGVFGIKEAFASKLMKGLTVKIIEIFPS
jgi:Uma2 family endonuclease